MPTKTTTKKAARKPTAGKTLKSAASKAKAAKSDNVASPSKPARAQSAAAKSPASPETTAPSTPAPRPVIESVSLIDEKKPRQKREDGAVKGVVLPPISRIRASLEAPSIPPRAERTPAVGATADPQGAAPSAIVDGRLRRLRLRQSRNSSRRKSFTSSRRSSSRNSRLELGLKPHQLIAELMTFNIFANINQTIEPDIASKICENHGFVLEKERREKGAGVHKIEQVVVAPPKPVIEKEEELKSRGPIITFMGHVDHGKTSLLDAIRKTRVTASEAGGITQHIGAYSVDHKGTKITFIDTPGHAAFTAMRARGANVTDIVVLVVAADDGLMPQTLEAISHAKAAPHVKIMVAINKVDLPSANIDRVKKQLQEQDLTPEDWGGETIVCPVSATKGIGIDHLLEMMALQAEVMELKASPTATPRGTVIEAQVEAGRGPTATVIVQMGTLKIGDAFICGDYSGKVKSLLDDRGEPIKQAGPSTPVKVLGFTGLPNAGDEFLVMESERAAKTLSEERLQTKRADKLTVPQRATLESLLDATEGKKNSAHRFEMRRPGLGRSAGGRVETNREQKSRSRNHSLSGRTDLGIGHSAGERIECRRDRLQHQSREHGGFGGKTRRRPGQALQHHLRIDRPDQRSDGRPARTRTIAKRSSVTPK